MNLRYYLFVFGFNQRNEKVTRVKDFLVLPQGFESFSQTFHEQGGRIQCVCIGDWANSGWFLFYWGLMLLWVMGVGFENTCKVSGK